eukprot:237935_1
MSAKNKILNGKTAQYGSVSIVANNNDIPPKQSGYLNNQSILFQLFVVALVICIIIRFGFYYESSDNLNIQTNNNNLHLLPVCEKGAVGGNWKNNLVIFGGKTKAKYIGSKFVNYVLYLTNSNSKYKWKESFAEVNNSYADNIRLPQALWKSDGVLLENDLYIYGGSTGPHRLTEQNNMWKYNLVSKTWKKLPFETFTFHPYVRGHCMALYGDIIILFGGKNISGYDQNWIMQYDTKQPEQGFVQFVIDGQLPGDRQATTCQVINDQFIVFGGRLEAKSGNASSISKTFSYYNDFWSFDLKTNEWNEIEVENMEQWPGEAAHLSSAIYNENKFVITAGHNNNSVLRQNWMFDFDSYVWNQLADVPVGNERCLHVGTYINGKGILIFGGQQNLPDIINAKNMLLNDVLLYEFDTNEWSVIKPNHCKKAQEYWSARKLL